MDITARKKYREFLLSEGRLLMVIVEKDFRASQFRCLLIIQEYRAYITVSGHGSTLREAFGHLRWDIAKHDNPGAMMAKVRMSVDE